MIRSLRSSEVHREPQRQIIAMMERDRKDRRIMRHQLEVFRQQAGN
jgi:hypothetical protein